jgi:hypothetical protein
MSVFATLHLSAWGGEAVMAFTYVQRTGHFYRPQGRWQAAGHLDRYSGAETGTPANKFW